MVNVGKHVPVFMEYLGHCLRCSPLEFFIIDNLRLAPLLALSGFTASP